MLNKHTYYTKSITINEKIIVKFVTYRKVEIYKIQPKLSLSSDVYALKSLVVW